MTSALRPRTIVLFVGDIVAFVAALWLALFLRSFEVPSGPLFAAHLVPFSLLFVVWVVVFFIAGLYESRSIILARRSLSVSLMASQVFNVIIAAMFFFFVPIYGIAPKTVLVIYLAVSFVLVLLWRAALFPRLMLARPEPAIVVGEGPQIDELIEALAQAPLAPARVVAIIAPSGASPLIDAVNEGIRSLRPRFVIADWSDRRVAHAFPEIYNYLAEGVRFVDAIALYEEVFGRISLPHIDDQWVARNISRYAHTLYDPLKRAMDIVVGLAAGLLSLVVYPFVWLAIKLEDGGPLFIVQERVGEGHRIIRMRKFRSMQRNDTDLSSTRHTSNQITRVGRILRTTRIDEIPQLWSVVAGDLSLIGPRPELPSGVALYDKEIPYYGVRHLIKPGLSGWAQLYGQHAHHGVGVEETRDKLAHDLYYIKHRSLALDGAIALKTIKKLLTRSGV